SDNIRDEHELADCVKLRFYRHWIESGWKASRGLYVDCVQRRSNGNCGHSRRLQGITALRHARLIDVIG
ncbi:MAG: hypothetical protein ACK5SP_01090, partial [bacterium]